MRDRRSLRVGRALESFREREGGRRIAFVERELHRSEARHGMELRLREQCARLVEPALAPPQLAESRGSLDERRAPAASEHGDRGGQLLLGLAPRPLVDEHGGVLRAAHVEEGSQLPAPCELLHLVAPLGRALDVADAVARSDQVAAHLRGPHEIVDLAGCRSRRRLVEPSHPLVDCALLDEGEPLERTPDDLHVLVAASPLRSRLHAARPRGRRRACRR